MMYGSFLKEMGEIPKWMGIHPMTTMLGADTLELTNMVNLTPPSRLSIHSWLNEDN